MKRIIYITILFTICGMTAMAQNRPTGTHHTSGGNRDFVKFYNDRPTLSYNEGTNEISVYGYESDYYYLVITSVASQQQIFEAVLDGNYDIIDASIMTNGTYIIALTSAHGRTYKWTFNNGLQGEVIVIEKPNGNLNTVSDFNPTTFERN